MKKFITSWYYRTHRAAFNEWKFNTKQLLIWEASETQKIKSHIIDFVCRRALLLEQLLLKEGVGERTIQTFLLTYEKINWIRKMHRVVKMHQAEDNILNYFLQWNDFDELKYFLVNRAYYISARRRSPVLRYFFSQWRFAEDFMSQA